MLHLPRLGEVACVSHPQCNGIASARGNGLSDHRRPSTSSQLVCVAYGRLADRLRLEDARWTGWTRITASKGYRRPDGKRRRGNSGRGRANRYKKQPVSGFFVDEFVRKQDHQTRRQAVSLPDGIELLLGRAVSTSFQCTRDGYYADVETNCQVFHVCRGVTKEDGNVEYEHHAFACGNQTIAKDFYYLNERLFQDKDTPILGDEEAQKAAEFYPARIAAAAAAAAKA
ncbi:hypothetical protein HPB50_023805 [Hyalomma asiaticum]|uniref:Uncharacterized protein n=1 Tax=Hyalomma asiaticum TaxID=266040 RepID=A0ACB7SQ65_HYAAI|nr:hypothetical protein HPB50_023805 [Hyalomma asiaticum]